MRLTDCSAQIAHILTLKLYVPSPAFNYELRGRVALALGSSLDSELLSYV